MSEKTTKLHMKFVGSLSQEEKHAFAIYLMVKNCFVSGRVYRYNPKKLSELINVSAFLIRRYMPIILKKRWGVITSNKELVMFGIRKVLKSRGFVANSVTISDKDKLRSVVDKLNFIILKNNLRTQEFVLEIKDYLHKGKQPSVPGEHFDGNKYKRLKRGYGSIYGSDGSFIKGTVIGLRRLARLLKSSVSYAARFMKRLISEGLITAEEVCFVEAYNVPSNMMSQYDQSDDFGYIYVSNNKLIRHLGRLVTILDNTDNTVPIQTATERPPCGRN
jgi:hypothetical protein